MTEKTTLVTEKALILIIQSGLFYMTRVYAPFCLMRHCYAPKAINITYWLICHTRVVVQS